MTANQMSEKGHYSAVAGERVRAILLSFVLINNCNTNSSRITIVLHHLFIEIEKAEIFAK